jgi:hypothetical protein
MIMMDQSKRLSEPLRWGKREKTVVAAVLACTVVIVLALGAYALTAGAPARRDCIEVNFASTLGGATEHACGAQARRVCASPDSFKHVAAELAESCRRAGFPFASRS